MNTQAFNNRKGRLVELVWRRPLALWLLPVIFLFISTTLPLLADRFSFAYTATPFTGMLSVIMSFVLVHHFFGFIHDQDKGDFYFALPQSREKLFFSLNAGALGYLVGPSLAIMALNTLLAQFAAGPVPWWMSHTLSLDAIWSSYLSLILRVVYFFLLLEICYLVTDKAATAIGTFLLINLFWPLLIYLYSDATAQFLPGFINPVTTSSVDATPGLTALLQIFSPGLFILGLEDFHWVTGLLILAAGIFAFFLFRNRNTGMAPGVDSINWPFEMTQWMGIMTVTLLGGYGAHYLRVLAAQDNLASAASPQPFLIGAGLGFLLALWIFNIIRGKGRIRWRALIPAAALTLIPFAVWLFVVMSGAGGFSSRLPEAGETNKIQLHYSHGLVTERNPDQSQAHILELSDQEDLENFRRLCSQVLNEDNPGLALPRTLASRSLAEAYAVRQANFDFLDDPEPERYFYKWLAETRFSAEDKEGRTFHRAIFLPSSDWNPDYLELLARNRRFYMAELSSYSLQRLMNADFRIEATPYASQKDRETWIKILAGDTGEGMDSSKHEWVLEEMSRQIAGYLLSQTDEYYLELLETAPALIHFSPYLNEEAGSVPGGQELLLPADLDRIPGLKSTMDDLLSYYYIEVLENEGGYE